MNPTEAAALAILGNRDRRLLAALLRVLHGRGSFEDIESLPPRHADETVVAWACRSAGRAGDCAEAEAEGQRLQMLAGDQLSRAQQLGIRWASLDDDSYPPLLAAIPDPPSLLWVRGQLDPLQRGGIAIVGSRAATPHGLEMASRLAADLARSGVVIVSGLARGVDSAAHAAALDAGGATVGVLGCGIDRIYPAEHRDLASNMAHDGAVISEFPVGVPPLPHQFPLRNRIISGLSRAVVVIEAGEKSGALITASAALEQGRDVFVVPGEAAGGRNRGGHLLIRDGARLVESAADILGECEGLSLTVGIDRNQEVDQLPEIVAFTVDDVAARSGDPPNVVLARLLELELAGVIRRVEGGRFVRAVDRPASGPRVTV